MKKSIIHDEPSPETKLEEKIKTLKSQSFARQNKKTMIDDEPMPDRIDVEDLPTNDP